MIYFFKILILIKFFSYINLKYYKKLFYKYKFFHKLINL
jgi:hypothetical protein